MIRDREKYVASVRVKETHQRSATIAYLKRYRSSGVSIRRVLEGDSSQEIVLHVFSNNPQKFFVHLFWNCKELEWGNIERSDWPDFLKQKDMEQYMYVLHLFYADSYDEVERCVLSITNRDIEIEKVTPISATQMMIILHASSSEKAHGFMTNMSSGSLLTNPLPKAANHRESPPPNGTIGEFEPLS